MIWGNKKLLGKDKSKEIEEKRLKKLFENVYNNIDSVKLIKIFQKIGDGIGVHIEEAGFPRISLYYDDANKHSGYYDSVEKKVYINTFAAEKVFLLHRKNLPKLTESILLEYSFIQTYIHEMIHFFSDRSVYEGVLGLEDRSDGEIHYRGINEAITELLTQQITDDYYDGYFKRIKYSEKAPMFYRNYQELFREIYLYFADYVTYVLENKIDRESLWREFLSSFFEGIPFQETKLFASMQSQFSKDFMTDLYHLGFYNQSYHFDIKPDELEEEFTVDRMLSEISELRRQNNLPEIDDVNRHRI